MKNKKIIGASIAGILTLTSVSGSINLGTQTIVKAASKDELAVQNKINHIINSLKKNYLGLNSVGQWQEYIKEARKLNNILPSGTSKNNYAGQINKAESLVNSAASVNQVEKSMEKNALVMKNVPQWNSYIKLAKDNLSKVDMEFTNQISDLEKRIEKVTNRISEIESKYSEVSLEKEIKNGEIIDLANAPKGLFPQNDAEYFVLWKKNNKTEEYERIKNYDKGDAIKIIGEYNLYLIPSGKTINFKVVDSSGKMGSIWEEKNEENNVKQEDIVVKMSSEVNKYDNGKIIENGGKSNRNVKIEWDNEDITGVTLQKNNETEKPYNLGTLIKDEGKYSVKATYKSGKTISVNFEIDKTPPVLTSKTHDIGEILWLNKDEQWHKLRAQYKAIGTLEDISFESPSDDIMEVRIKNIDNVYSKPYEFGTPITENGSYLLYAEDYSRNVGQIYFTVYKSLPVVTGVKNGDVIDLKDSPDGVKVEAQGVQINFDFRKDGKEDYSKDSYIGKVEHDFDEDKMKGTTRYTFTYNKVGKYEFISKNKAGETKVSFEIIDTRN